MTEKRIGGSPPAHQFQENQGSRPAGRDGGEGMKPIAIDLFCGLGGWTEGLLAEGYDVIGFDIEQHVYGEMRYPAQLVLQDVLTIHGSQFRNASLIVASPPCQEYSYMAMPWSLAKAKRADILNAPTSRADLTRLFDACFRIQREACEAAGRHIPLVVENVRGAQEWVGRARWNFGSFYFWGDTPALMPVWQKYKSSGLNWSNQELRGQDFTMVAGQQSEGLKNMGLHCSYQELRQHFDGIKSGGGRFNAPPTSISRLTSSKSPARKMASAVIAKIPMPVSRHIGATYYPQRAVARKNPNT